MPDFVLLFFFFWIINIFDFFRIELGKAPHVKTAAKLFNQILYSNKDRLLAGIIVAGWDPYDGPQVFSLPLGGSCTKVPYAIGGSGSGFIYGYCDANFKENMTKEEAEKFAKNGKWNKLVLVLMQLCLWMRRLMHSKIF